MDGSVLCTSSTGMGDPTPTEEAFIVKVSTSVAFEVSKAGLVMAALNRFGTVKILPPGGRYLLTPRDSQPVVPAAVVEAVLQIQGVTSAEFTSSSDTAADPAQP